MAQSDGNLSGELGLVNLFDLGQLLTLNRATGRLAVDSDGKRGALIFRDGRIVNAVDEKRREGEGAAYRVFEWKSGRFTFTHEPVGPGDSIEVGSEALMLEAARRLDEASTAAGGEAGTQARVRERQGAMEALRDVFKNLAHEAHAIDAEPASIYGAFADAMSRPGDRMVLRPNRAARLCVKGVWRDVHDAALSQSEYEDFKLRLLGPTGLREASSGDRPTRFATLPGPRLVAVTLVAPGPDEALWLRPVHVAPPDPARLKGGREALTRILALPRALLLIGGGDSEAAREVLHAVLAELHARANECLLLARDLPVYRHPERAGILAECSPAELSTGLLAAQPKTLLLDVGAAIAEGQLAGLDEVRRIVARLPGAGAASVGASWRTRFSGRDREALTAHTTGWPTFLALATATGAGEPQIAFEVWQMTGGALSPVNPSGPIPATQSGDDEMAQAA
ncbi:MAG TPA: DUF4388 domain-containing protein [Candidatus Sulfotelmatobacter sp.]|nr:DUF4388 domain-containing protein [Candidatus Sulfotelmatobacter sp.]